MLHLQALQHRGLIKLLTTTQLFNNTRLLKLSLKLLEGLLILFFDFKFKLLYISARVRAVCARKAAAKVRIICETTKFFAQIFQSHEKICIIIWLYAKIFVILRRKFE